MTADRLLKDVAVFAFLSVGSFVMGKTSHQHKVRGHSRSPIGRGAEGLRMRD